MYLLFPQPLFSGPTAVRPLTPDAFKSLVEDGPSDVAWLVRCLGCAGACTETRCCSCTCRCHAPPDGTQELLLFCKTVAACAPLRLQANLYAPASPPTCARNSSATTKHAPLPSLPAQVEFYAPWSPPCIHLEPVVAELSLKYSCSRLQFGRVDAPR